MTDADKPDLTTLTVQLLSAYVGNNSVAPEALPELIAATRSALSGEAAPVIPTEPEYVPAVSVRKSLSSPNHILSMIDGKPYKTLKRHIGIHGMTPAEYRSRYSLPKDYPMVAPAYSEQRRATAERIGLGTKFRRPAGSDSKDDISAVADAQAKAPAEPAPSVEAAPAAKEASSPTTKRPRKKLSIALAKVEPAKARTKKVPAAKRSEPDPAIVTDTARPKPAKQPRRTARGKSGTPEAKAASAEATGEPVRRKVGRPRKVRDGETAS